MSDYRVYVPAPPVTEGGPVRLLDTERLADDCALFLRRLRRGRPLPRSERRAAGREWVRACQGWGIDPSSPPGWLGVPPAWAVELADHAKLDGGPTE